MGALLTWLTTKVYPHALNVSLGSPAGLPLRNVGDFCHQQINSTLMKTTLRGHVGSKLSAKVS
jgi:hypothetical protein